MTPCCFDCRYWASTDEQEIGADGMKGECRRYPPVPLMVIYSITDVPDTVAKMVESDTVSGFPEAYGGQWCGEYLAKPVT